MIPFEPYCVEAVVFVDISFGTATFGNGTLVYWISCSAVENKDSGKVMRMTHLQQAGPCQKAHGCFMRTAVNPRLSTNWAKV